MRELRLTSEIIHSLDMAVREYIIDTKVRSVFIINTAGQVLYQRGISKNDHFIQSIGALTAGIFNATGAIAKLIAEDYFNVIFQEGSRYSLFYFAINNDNIFLAFYDKQTIIGIIRVMTEKLAEFIDTLLIEPEVEDEVIHHVDDSVFDEDYKHSLENIIDDMFS